MADRRPTQRPRRERAAASPGRLCWLRHPSAMHDGLRLIDLLWPLVLAPPFLLLRGSGWALIWYPAGVAAVIRSYRTVPSCRTHDTAGVTP